MSPPLYSGFPQYPPPLSQQQEDNLLFTLKDWAIAHGLAVRPSTTFIPEDKDPAGVLAVTAPVTLFPSLFPRVCYQQGLDIAEAYNELYAKISMDEEWLGRIMRELVKVDDFMESLWNIHLKVKEEGYAQDLSLGLFRSDYMVHLDPSTTHAQPTIRQVEFNTISSSFGGLSTQVADLHRYLQKIDAYPDHPVWDLANQPKSTATVSLAEGLAAAHTAYGASRSAPPLKTCILFVVQHPERNIFDQRHLEYHLQSLPASPPVFRIPFDAVPRLTSIPPSNLSRPLIYHPPHQPGMSYEVSVLYFRSTYTPSDFPNQSAWDARYQLERSAAIKCPSILTHLAGAKKVQQVLATPGSPHLARFLQDPTTAERLRETFAAIYPMDDSAAGREAKNLALDESAAERYVLKPQREGGGNNVYGAKIPKFLKETLGDDEGRWAGHILMELIKPPAQDNAIVREGKLMRGGVIVELGVYGTCLWRHGSGKAPDGEVLRNQEAGYLLRTKGKESEEGGVAAGFGSVDSVLLVDV